VDLASIPLESVERIEVLRGGASAAWGADAIGGAVHVTTRGATSVVPRVRVGAASAGAKEIAGSAGTAIAAGWSARAGASYEDFRGDASVPGAEVEHIANSDAERAAADVRFEGPLGSGFAARADGSILRLRRGVPGSEEFPTPSARLADDRETVGLRIERGGGGSFVPSLDVAATAMARRYQEPQASLGSIDESHENRRIEGEAGGAWLGRRTSVRAFAGAVRDRLQSTTDGRRERRGAYARVHYARDDVVGGRALRTLGSVRVDAVEGFTTFLSPRAGFQVDALPEKLAVRASAGLSFRPPTFDDLFWPARATAAGNPDLRAETARDADLGLAWTAREARVGVEAFARRVDDLIQWAPGAGGVWRPVNVGRAHISGIEAFGDARVPAPFGTAAIVEGALARTWTRDASGEPNVDGNELVYRPRWTGTASIALARPERAELAFAVRVLGDSWITRANTKLLRGSTLLDVRARVHAFRGVALDAAVTNLLDRPARDLRDFPLPGRSIEVGITLEGRAR
jgi:outer membrane cobalamin receptor